MDTLQVSRTSITGWIVGFFIVANKIAQVTSDDVGHGMSPDSSYFLYQQSEYPRDCKEVVDQCSSMNSSGVHYIRPEGYPESFEVYCVNGESTGWTVIQTRQMNGSVDFNRNWNSYERGFGFLSHEYWIGNEKLSFLTNQMDYELLIEMTTFNGTVISMSYNNFRIGDEYSNYKLISISQNFIENGYISWLPAVRKDCQDLYNAGIRENGIYTINPPSGPASGFRVYCNMTDDGGWTVFQRRVDGSVDFYRDWQSYKAGFGDLTNEFWLGNDKIYYLTNQGSYQMRIDFVNANGAPYYAEYSSFRINNEADNYRLVLGTYSGNAGYDALSTTYHRDKPFSTKDRDNDAWSSNCAVTYHGAWWYGNCHHSNLNGGYHNSGNDGLRWYNLPGNSYDIQFTEMKIRPA